MIKKILASALLTLGLLLGMPAMAYTYLDVGSADVSAIAAYAGTIYSDIGLFIALAMGAPLAFWFIKKIISLIRGSMR